MLGTATFCTAISSTDGRTQLPVNQFLKKRFGADHVDTVTETGPVAVLASQSNQALVQSILDRVNISVNKHSSRGIGIVAHHDCAGNPVAKDTQLAHLRMSGKFVKSQYPVLSVALLWVNEQWNVEEII
jgi:hypothetical protein